MSKNFSAVMRGSIRYSNLNTKISIEWLCSVVARKNLMSINNIQATKYFDEVRSYFGSQAQLGQSIDLVIKAVQRPDGAVFIGIFDGHNPSAVPVALMLNLLGTGRRWTNELSTTGEVYNVVNAALVAFDKQKERWKNENIDFQLKDAIDFLVGFMRQVSDFLR